MNMSKLALSLTCILVLTISVATAATLTDQCTDSFTKVAACISFATGKGTTPGDDCCKSVDQIKNSNPVCLCYIIVETHNGSESTKSAGLQEARLLQLPSACRLKNASLAECPKLLNIPRTSPTYSIFTNTTTPSTPSTGTSSSTSPTANDNSVPFNAAPSLVGLVAVSMAIFVLFSPPLH